MKAWINSLLTEEDDSTPNIVSVVWVIGVISFIVFAGAAVLHSGAFDAQAYGIGFGSLMGGGGCAMFAKQKSGA